MKLLFIAAAGLAATAAPAAAQDQVGPDDVRVNQLIIYGDDPCPPSTDDEIIICARKPESDRYRIPENLRGLDDPRSESWANRAMELRYVGRTGIGSCSTVGPGGFTGCLEQIIRQAREERQNRDEVDWNLLIEQARQERLGRIDEEAAAVEREIRGDD